MFVFLPKTLQDEGSLQALCSFEKIGNRIVVGTSFWGVGWRFKLSKRYVFLQNLVNSSLNIKLKMGGLLSLAHAEPQRKHHPISTLFYIFKLFHVWLKPFLCKKRKSAYMHTYPHSKIWLKYSLQLLMLINCACFLLNMLLFTGIFRISAMLLNSYLCHTWTSLWGLYCSFHWLLPNNILPDVSEVKLTYWLFYCY